MATGNAKGHYWQKQVLNAALRGTVAANPASVFLALFTVAPTDNAGGTEVTTSGTAYVRQTLTAGFAVATDNGATAGATTTNSGAINFPVATANYGTVVAWAIFDAVTAGNMLYWGLWNTAQAVNSGNQFTVPASSLTINEY